MGTLRFSWSRLHRHQHHTGFVRQSLLLRFVPFSKSTLWRRVKAGLFPAPVRISVGITAWRAEDVRHWIAEQK
ncbi:MAG: AlpA family phage regulatory protein [Acidovorax sp.]|nr:AlpA family phage regulatory protein [Acidovorax sp.]